MSWDRKMGFAAGGSVLAHLLLAGGATTMLAFYRASPPENDDFASGRVLRGALEATAFGDSRYATRELGEPVHAAGAGGSVWWRWEAPAVPCAVRVQVVADGFEEVVAVYRGAVLETLSEVVSRGVGDGAMLEFMAEPGTRYHIAVAGGEAGGEGGIELRIVADPEMEETVPDELVMLLPDLLSFEPAQEEPPKEDPAFSKTDGDDTLAEAPEDAAFQSDRNRAAAGEDAPDDAGDEGVGTQDGEAGLPFAPKIEITPLWETESGLSVSADGFTKVPEIEVPTTAELEAAEPSEAVVSAFETEPIAVPAEEILPAPIETVPETMVEPTPVEPVAEPPGFRPKSVKARTIGKADAGEEAAVATAETPVGRYQAAIDSGVQQSSQREREAHGPFGEIGFLKVRLWVNREGAVVNTKVLYSDATPEMIALAVRGLRGAELPPMPDEVYEAAPDGLIDMVYDIFF